MNGANFGFGSRAGAVGGGGVTWRKSDAAQFPGAHCGLFEAAMLSPFFPSSIGLVIAPPSCLYHAKLLNQRRGQAPSSLEDNLYLLNLKQEDMVFGVDWVIEEALEDLDQRLKPEIIFLISTCTPEIIGFDDASLTFIKSRLNAKVLTVQTNGYACLHRQKGRSDFLASLVDVMKPSEVKPLTVNILGLRSPDWRKTELVEVLERSGVEVSAALPGASRLSQIEKAPEAALNIAIGKAALPLAEKMKEKFGTPFIAFDHSYLTEEIIRKYRVIGTMLDVDIGPAISEQAERHSEFLAEKKGQLAEVSFAIGSVDGNNLEAALFYAKLGMKPQFLQTRMPVAENDVYLEELKQLGFELPVIHMNKTSKLEELLQQYHPQVFIGHGLAELMKKRGVSQSHPGAHIYGPGFVAVEQELENIAHLTRCDCGKAGV